MAKIYGYIYKISSPATNRVYIGKTRKDPKKRFQEHKRDALSNKKPTKGNGALYEVMRAFGVGQFSIETLTSANSEKELCQLERKYIQKYDSVKNGLNRVYAPKSSHLINNKIKININGEIKKYPSIAELCRDLKICNTTLNYWRIKRNLPLRDAIKKSLKASQKTSSKGFYCYRKFYETYTELAKDKRVNRYKLSGREIAARVRKGMSPEEALEKPKPVRKEFILRIDGKEYKWYGILDMYNDLKKKYKLPAYSTVVQRIDRGETVETALGLRRRPWRDRFKEYEKLVNEKGYKWVGDLKSWSIPIVVHHTKEIFSSKKNFAKAYGLEYTETSKKLKNGITPQEILKQSGHL